MVVCTTGAPQAEAPGPKVGQILIEGLSRTRVQTVQRELLFAPGQPLDSARVAESLRQLRRLPFVANPRFVLTPRDSLVDIKIQLDELYSRALSPLLAGEAGELSFGLVALDYNFRGRGQTAQLTLEHRALEGQWAAGYFGLPRLADSPRDLTLNAGLGSEGHDLRLDLTRPFRTLDGRRQYAYGLKHNASVQRRYAGGRLAASYTDQSMEGSLRHSWSFGNTVKTRPGFALALDDRRFRAVRLHGAVRDAADSSVASPRSVLGLADRRRLIASTHVTFWRPQYRQDRFIHSLGQTEDLQTGSWLTLRGGLSPAALGTERPFTFGQIHLAPRLSPWPGTYIEGTLFGSSRWQDGGYTNAWGVAEILLFSRLGAAHSVAARLQVSGISRSEDNGQLLLGVERGLRGYAPRRFDGEVLLLGNIEFRPTFLVHPDYILAGVLFADIGTAWTPATQSPQAHPAIGLGLRLGLPRVYNTPILRADLAYGEALQLSFGIGQYF